MEPPIEINSISIDLADAANEVDRCDHFTIRGFVAQMREKALCKCWPFSKESLSLVDEQNYSLPLFVPNFRWWRCTSCVKDIDDDETKTNDCENSEKNLDGTTLVIPTTSMNPVINILELMKEKKADVAVNAIEENENANRELSQKNDHQTGNAIEENENANREISQKDDRQTDAGTMVLKKANPCATDAPTVRSKSRKLAISEQVVSNRKSKGRQKQKMVQAGSSEIAGVVEDNPRRANKRRKGTPVQMECEIGSSDGEKRRKTPKLRLLSELVGIANTETSGGSNTNTRKEETGSKRESVRGRKRKLVPENNDVSRKLSTTSENASKSVESDSQSTDSGPIKGKQKNRRFQVVDDFVPSSSLPCEEGVHENGKSAPVQDLVPCPTPSTQRTYKKKAKKTVTDNAKSSLITFATGKDQRNQVKPRNGPLIDAVSQLSTRDLLTAKKAGSVLDNRLAPERYYSRYKPQPMVTWPVQDNGWSTTGVDVAEPRSNNNNKTAEVLDRSLVLKKDASGADRKGKRVMVEEEDHGGASRSQSNDKKAPEEQNDDIPMEIVELMAKNQYERCLPDKEEDVSNKQPTQETVNKSKNGLLIDLNETYEDNNNNTSRQPNPLGNDARNDGHIPMGIPQKPLDFFPISKPYVPPPFGIFPPTQENRASSIQFSGQTRPWLGNVPTMATNQNSSPYRVLRACNTCETNPHQYREAPPSPIWPSSMTQPVQGYHHKQVSFNMGQPSMPPQAPPSTNEHPWNLNFVGANGKQKCGPNSSAAGASHGSRSSDAFSSESSIPAMDLLSLMDPRLKSNAPITPHVNAAKFTERRFPPVTGLQTGESSMPHFPTKHLPFNFYNQRSAPPEPSRTSFPVPIGQPLGPSSFTFQNGQTSWSHQQQQHQEMKNKRKDIMGPPPVYSRREKQPVFASCSGSGSEQGKFQLLGASNSMMLPLRSHVTGKEKRKVDSSSNNAAVFARKNVSGPMVCCVNRNPADFTIPEPGNVYMIPGESLKVRKRAVYKRKPSLSKQDASKRSKKLVGPATENGVKDT